MAFYPGVSEDFVRVGGLRVEYYDSAPDSASAPIVLLHGTGGSAELNWWALFPMLAQRHRVVALDFIDPLDPETDQDSYIAQALAVIRSVSPDQPIELVGYSFGAVIAALLAARHAKNVRSLTLLCGWCKTDAQQQLRNDLWFALREQDRSALALFTVLATYSPRFINTRLPHEFDALVSGVRNGPDRSAKMRFNRSVDITGEIGSITAPTLVIGCTQDLMAPIHHSQLLFGAIIDARFAAIESGHGVVTERPSEVFTMIDTFLQKPGAVPAGGVVVNSHA